MDDLLNGGTANCVSKILKSKNKEVSGLLVVVELMELEGKSKLNFLSNHPLFLNLIKIKFPPKMVLISVNLFLINRKLIRNYKLDKLIK